MSGLDQILNIKNVSGDVLEVTCRRPESDGSIVQIMRPGETIHTLNMMSTETFTVRRLSHDEIVRFYGDKFVTGEKTEVKK